MNRIVQFTLIVLMLSFLFPACIKEEIRLNRYHRKLIDSLTALQTTVILEEMDSLCDLQMEVEVQAATDSIVQERLNEIRRKIEIEHNEQSN